MLKRAALIAGLSLSGVAALRVPVAQPVSRRAAIAAFGAGGAALLAADAPALAATKPASDGKWAARYEEFAAEEFADFSSTASGLQYQVIEEGFGVKPLSGQKVKAHYAGYLYPSGAKFDASYDRRSPLEFQVGVGRVIKGWDEALLDMKVGEKRMLKIPPALGYGSRGAGGVIPPDATLVFYVELVSLAA
jgi:peptidylprolyl isomerase